MSESFGFREFFKSMSVTSPNLSRRERRRWWAGFLGALGLGVLIVLAFIASSKA